MLRNASALVMSLALLSACDKDPSKPAAKDPVAEPEAAKPTPTKDLPSSDTDVTAVVSVMTPYETCRNTLATDSGELATCAAAVSQAAGKVPKGGAWSAAQEVSKAAVALAAAPASNIEKQRLAFGELSKSIEAMLLAAPMAASKYKMYECPMAKGFKRWAQPAEGDSVAMANPYMGQKMLTCGMEVSGHMKEMKMEHEGMKDGDMATK